MKLIPGGEYFMGSDEKDAEANEKPPHKVKLAPYCLDELEVSVARYKACSDRGACLRAAKENDWESITPVQHKILRSALQHRRSGRSGRASDQLRELGAGAEVLRSRGCAAPDRGRVGVRGAWLRRADLSLGR